MFSTNRALVPGKALSPFIWLVTPFEVFAMVMGSRRQAPGAG